MIMQTLAIVRDAYRDLNAKKLFWLVLMLSGIVVGSFAAVGVNEKGLEVFVWTIESRIFNSRLFPPAVFYKLMFATLGINFWLAWIAAILALVSTAGIIPDFISSGSIELVLSRPIGRLRLFLTKCLAGLLFVTLQVGVFSLAAFLVIGIRGRAWEPGLFWAVPLTVCFFSYLFAICVLLGMVTRSTIASLLLTLLVWAGIFGLHTTESLFLLLKEHNQLKLETLAKQVDELQAEKAATPAETPTGTDAPRPAQATGAKPRGPLERRREQLEETRQNSGWIRRTHSILFLVKTALPKTTETKDLLSRKLFTAADLDRMRQDQKEPPPMNFGADDVRVDEREVQRRIERIINERSVGWVIGTSLLFELVLVGAAAFMFCRRDF